MTIKTDEEILAKLQKFFHGKAIEEIVPILIVASARALVIEGEGEAHKVEALGAKFCSLLASTLADMLAEESVH